MSIIDSFTEGERKGVEQHFGTPWEELSETGKLMRGLMYRQCLSPAAISHHMVYGESKMFDPKVAAEVTKTGQEILRDLLDRFGDDNAVQHQGDGEGR